MTASDDYTRAPIMRPMPLRDSTDTRGQHLDTTPLDQLCQPLSATTQPREHMIGKDGEEISETHARRLQRQRVACAKGVK